MDASLLCRDERRRSDVRASWFNGFDYVEVEAGDAGHVQLRVFLLANDSAAAGTLDPTQFLITGGRRVPRIGVKAARYVPGSRAVDHARDQRDDTIVLTVQRPDDLSAYTLRLVRTPQRPPDAPDLFDSFDPRYRSLEFSFAAGEVSELDCAHPVICPPEPLEEPAIDYLARDYAGMRRLLFDRLALILPEWRRRPVPDQLVATVELLAYLGDRISYHQDAVGTEAYLGTARKRISIRRHARLVDYLMHEGCNARAFVCVSGPDSEPVDPTALTFLTGRPATPPGKGRQIGEGSSADSLATREIFLPLLPEPTPELRSNDIYDWNIMVREVREMLPATTDAPAPAARHAGRQRTTLEKAWALLPEARRELLRTEGFDPHLPLFQSSFERWVTAQRLWARIPEERLKEFRALNFEPLSDHWTTEWNRWNELKSIWPRLSAAAQGDLRAQGFDPELDGLRDATDGWFRLQRIGLRLPAKLRTALAGDFDPHDPDRQRALLRGLNRALHDRGLAESLPAATDGDVWKHNRDGFQSIFREALAEQGKLQFFAAHNELLFYTWGNRECCLPRGARRATLEDTFTGVAPTPAATPAPAYAEPDRRTCTTPPTPVERLRALHLRVGDVLIFEEILGPTTGLPGDANPAHRHAVLLTRVVPRIDALYDQPLVEIEWAEEDALPFPFCLSVRGPADAANPCEPIENITVARGNVVLADHGRRIVDEPIGKVPLKRLAAQCRCDGQLADPVTYPARFTPELARSDLTFAEPPRPLISATQALIQNPRLAIPGVRIESIAGDRNGEKPLFDWAELADVPRLAARLVLAVTAREAAPTAPAEAGPWQLLGRLSAVVRAALAAHGPVPGDVITELLQLITRSKYDWAPRFDLLGSGPEDRHFVVEMDEARRAHLRFGNNDLGQAPEAGAISRATYRVGNGLAGNIGADRIVEVRLGNGPLAGATARNPLPAAGGTVPESVEEVRRSAPFAFQRPLERAITSEDYQALAMQCPHVRIQGAAAKLEPYGTRQRITVAIDPIGREVAPAKLLHAIKAWLNPRRRIGHDVEVVTATLVPLRLTLHVQVQPRHEPAHVKEALLDIFGSGLRLNGQPGFFHPDKLTFGQAIRLSSIVALAQAVTGVASVEVHALQRLEPRETDPDALTTGVLPLEALEVARLDNDPSFPENGILKIETKSVL